MNYLNKINYNSTNILILICLISFWGGIIYRLYSLNYIGVIISLILAIISFFIIQRLKAKNKEPRPRQAQRGRQETCNIEYNAKIKILDLLPASCYLLLTAYSFYVLFSHQTTAAIISPWQAIPSYFFIIYGLATAILIIIILKHNNISTPYTLHPTPFIILHYFLSFSVALIIYKIGYGFDPFIHQATVDLINKTGSVGPKPFYYLGQYALIVIIHKITFLPLVWLDKLLVPLLAAIYLPTMLWRVLSKWFSDNTTSLLLILMLLILPFSFFIVTTPQNFAYLLLLLAILLGLICSNIFDLMVIYLLSLTAIVIQPIAGIPALLFSLLLTVYHSDIKKRYGVSLKKYFYLLISIASVFILPLAFVILSAVKDPGESAQNEILPPLSEVRMTVPGQENFILNFIYLYGFNIKIIIGLIAAVGLIIAYRHRGKCRIFFIYLIMSASLALSYLLTAKLPFAFLIDYERSNYSDRILLVTAFFLLPFILVALYAFISKTLNQIKSIKFPLLCFIVVLITASLYISYPRFDRYFNSHGYSVSQTDINAVHWIEENAGQDYIVLANQQVSAAALREFGFAKYYTSPLSRDGGTGEGLGVGEIFYYPVPTGGPMYQYYLDMVYKKPSSETMFTAMELAGVNEGYFVLNKYWWAFPKILEEAKLEAQAWEEINNGEIYIFKYLVD
jgi:hypothetical protein